MSKNSSPNNTADSNSMYSSISASPPITIRTTIAAQTSTIPDIPKKPKPGISNSITQNTMPIINIAITKGFISENSLAKLLSEKPSANILSIIFSP